MATRKSANSNTDRTMSVQEAGRRGGQRVQELVHKGEETESHGTNFGEQLPPASRSSRNAAKDR